MGSFSNWESLSIVWKKEHNGNKHYFLQQYIGSDWLSYSTIIQYIFKYITDTDKLGVHRRLQIQSKQKNKNLFTFLLINRVCSWQRGLNTKRPTLVFFWVPRNLSNHMDKQARTGATVLVKSRQRWYVGSKHCLDGWGKKG